MDRRSSLVASETTYHSFNDIELFEPASPPRKTARSSIRELNDTTMGRSPPDSRHSEDGPPPTSGQMKRQDSGYESHTTTPRTSLSRSRPSPPPRRRTSMSTNAAVPSSRPRTRPSTRRSTKSYHHPNSSSVHLARPLQQPPIQSSSYYHFPSPDPADDTHDPFDEPNPQGRNSSPAPPPVTQLPPQTTHYWTSDRTRRLEYAAIDAASRGLKGWIRRNLLPDCLAARDSDRHISFDDDTGSVRRYRLELEDEQADEKSAAHKRRTWHFWNGSDGR